MYVCVKFSPENLNPDPCLSHLTSTYTCRVTIVPRVIFGMLKYHLVCFSTPNSDRTIIYFFQFEFDTT